MLSPKQRAALAGAAQSLDCLASLGKAGASDAFVSRLEVLLRDHELVKLRFQGFKASKRELADELARRSRSELVTLIGNVAVLYRRSEDVERRKYEPGEE